MTSQPIYPPASYAIPQQPPQVKYFAFTVFFFVTFRLILQLAFYTAANKFFFSQGQNTRNEISFVYKKIFFSLSFSQMLYRPHTAPPPSYTMLQQPTYVNSAPMLTPTLPNYIYPPQVAFHGPPPSYGVPQYPTGYCPAPPYQRQIQPMQQHVMYSDPTMQVKNPPKKKQFIHFTDFSTFFCVSVR